MSVHPSFERGRCPNVVFFFFPYMALLLWYAAGVLYVVTEY